MGCTASREEGLTREQIVRIKEVEKILREDKKRFEHTHKLLLLGAGQSGKSTLARQMKIIYKNGFDKQDLEHYRETILTNVFMWMRALIIAAGRFGLELQKEENKEYATYWTDSTIQATSDITPEVAEKIKSLWSDETIRTTYDMRHRFQIGDSAQYYFENIDRISKADYSPTELDILYSRTRTTGIAELEFTVEEAHFLLVDVGGQRSERKKWIHCFEDVTSLIFFVAINEYNEVLYEDETVNRMHEAMKLFEEIVNCRWFAKSNVILFLNKSDIFKEKIKRFPLSGTFPNFHGGDDYSAAIKFLTSEFSALRRDKKSHNVYTHVTCATDTQNVKFVFSSVKDMILRSALDSLAF